MDLILPYCHLFFTATHLNGADSMFTDCLCLCGFQHSPEALKPMFRTLTNAASLPQIIVTPVVSTLSTSFMKSGEPRPCVPSGPYTPVAPTTLATALVAATSGATSK